MKIVSHLVSTTTAALVIILLLLFSSTSSAQRVDHKGREFRIVFMPTNGASEFPSFLLDISCEHPTTGTLTYLNSGKVDVVQVPIANVPVFVRLDSSQLMLPDPRAVEVTSRSLLLQFNDEVAVHGINTQRWSSDGFLALPLDILGTHYMVLSYPNTIVSDSIGQVDGRPDFRSQFAVVAVENATTVELVTTAPVNGWADVRPLTVTLNAGEVFLARAEGRAGADLTGTVVTATKPVAVFSGHQRANVAWNEAVGRDHLVEQLPPVDLWGTWAMVTPHFQLTKTIADANIVRVIAAQNNTVVSVDSSVVATVQAGQPLEIPLDAAKLITATGPILVAQYQHSSVPQDFVRLPFDTVGDPFMMLVPPRDYFDSAYAFINFQNGRELLYHFINVVMPTERINTLILDGGPVVSGFTRIPKTSYSYAQVQVAAGPHFIRADVPFGLYVYGYGPYNSYGFPAGMNFEPIPLGVDAPAEAPSSPALTTRLVGENLEVMIEGRMASVALFDALGRRVRSVTSDVESGRVNFNVADLPAGIYFCRVVLADGPVKVSGVALP